MNQTSSAVATFSQTLPPPSTEAANVSVLNMDKLVDKYNPPLMRKKTFSKELSMELRNLRRKGTSHYENSYHNSPHTSERSIVFDPNQVYELDKGQADAKLRVMKYKTDIGKEHERNEKFCQLKQKLNSMVEEHKLILGHTESSPIAKGKALCLSQKPKKHIDKRKSSRGIV